MTEILIGHRVRAWAPGRVNLIGDHTDYMGGLALPIALNLGTTIDGVVTGDRVELTTDLDGTTAYLPLIIDEPAQVEPQWARYVAGIIDQLKPSQGFVGTVSTSLPVGAGLSSSAALEVATALALGFNGDRRSLAEIAQGAEQRAAGVPCGIMDQLASVFGVAGHALLLDCRSLDVSPIAIHEGVDICVLNPGEARQLVSSGYADRRASCEAAELEIGPLRDATVEDLVSIGDDVTRRRARHVITENERVMVVADSLNSGDWQRAGAAMFESHRSLRDDFEVSTPTLNALVESLAETPGVHGARLTGAGFGGCVVALTEPGALPFTTPVQPSDGARLLN